MSHPKQSKTVHVEMLNDELCLYDWQRKEVHALNPTAATVWQLCDGQTSPQQMAGQLKGDLNAEQAEALVWASLEELRGANLLEGEVAKPAGRPLLTRRQMLKVLGGAAAGAALLPVVSSIVAPTPVAAQSPQPVQSIILYDAGGAFDGNLGGRAGADAICAASGNRPTGYTNFRAFISVIDTDEIRDMPANYGVPTNVPIVGQNGTQLASNWADLLDGNIDATLASAGSGGTSVEWWSGSGPDGAVRIAECYDWTSNSNVATGARGLNNVTTSDWLETGGPLPTCDVARSIKCIAY